MWILLKNVLRRSADLISTFKSNDFVHANANFFQILNRLPFPFLVHHKHRSSSMSNKGNQEPSTKIVQPKTKAGRRILEKKAPKIVSIVLIILQRWCSHHKSAMPLFVFEFCCRLKILVGRSSSLAPRPARSSKMHSQTFTNSKGYVCCTHWTSNLHEKWELHS